MTYWVYILASQRNGTLYVGVTNSLERRVGEHRKKVFSGFTAKYGVRHLVWFHGFGEITEAIHFEKQLKRWRRAWKLRLIERDNPEWEDLSEGWFDGAGAEVLGPGLSRAAKTGMTAERMER
jgi:putative endonuclease